MNHRSCGDGCERGHDPVVSSADLCSASNAAPSPAQPAGVHSVSADLTWNTPSSSSRSEELILV